MMLSSAAAGPVGRRLACSQFWSVFTLTPINCANSDCERLVRSRMSRIPEGRITIRREGFRRPRKIPPASRTLPSSSSNISFFTFELPFDDFSKLRNLFRGQIRRFVLRIRVEQQNHVSPYCPIVDDAGTTALSSRSDGDTNLTYPAPTLDESTEFRVGGNP